MKRISRFAVMTMLGLFLLGGTPVFAGSGGDGNSQGGNNQGGNGGILQWLDNLLNGDDNNQGNNNQGNNGGNSSCSGTPGTTNGGGGGTAPIDGGISLLLAAGVGLGVRKLGKRP